MVIQDDVVILETPEDIKNMCEKYQCSSYNELKDTLWFNYGVVVMIHSRVIKK